MLTRFFNEARAAHAIRHPGIVEIYDSGPLETGGAYIIMEFLDGESLAARLRRGRIPIPEVIDIASQAADALGTAHVQGIVHRDLKPDNIFLIPSAAEPGRFGVKILDFGIAKLNKVQLGSGSVRTRTGAVLGTPLYMSPEQCRGTREIDHRSDIYSLGVILYEMVTGRPPFVSEGFGELAHMHIAVPPPAPRPQIPDLPRQLEQGLLKALAKDPAARFQSMGDFQQGIGAARTLAVDSIPLPSDHRPSPPMGVTTLAGSATAFEMKLTGARNRRRGSLVIAGTATLVAAAAYLAWRPEPKRAPPPSAPEAVLPVPAPAPPPPPPAPVPAPPSSPAHQPGRTVVVRIDSKPAGARIRRERDGALIGETPFEESWRLDKGIERLRIERDGYRAGKVDVPLERGVIASEDLQRERQVRRAARPRSTPAPAKWEPAAPPKWDGPATPAAPSSVVPAKI
jgi:serine/threonine-protein kinase